MLLLCSANFVKKAVAEELALWPNLT